MAYTIDKGFGDPSSGGSFSAGVLYSDGIDLPTGRAMYGGIHGVIITHLFAYIGSVSGTQDGVSLQLGSKAVTSDFSVTEHSSNGGSGWRNCVDTFVNGGTARFQVNNKPYGPLYFGHGGSGTTNGPAGYVRSGTIGGAYRYAQAPAAPTLSKAESTTSSGQIKLTFTAPADNGGATISAYYVQWATNSGFSANVDNLVTTSGTPTITGLTPGTRYYFRVMAQNGVTKAAGALGGTWSTVLNQVAPGAPSAPQSLSAASSTTLSGSIKLTWTAPSSTAGGITGYSIYKSGTLFGTTTGTGTSYTATGLTKNASHSFTVRARNDWADDNNKTSADSNTATATAPGAPSAPRNLTAIADPAVGGRVALDWDAPTTTGIGGITHYSVFSSSGAQLAYLSGSTTAYTVNGLTPGSTYGFYVTAWNAIAEAEGVSSTKSGTATATALGEPETPQNVTASPNAAIVGRLTLSWTQPGIYQDFLVYENTAGVERLLGSTTKLSYIMDDLPLTQHSYYIVARNSAGTGDPSASAVGTPSFSALQNVPNLTVSNLTSDDFSGTYNISAVSANTVSYMVSSTATVAETATSGTLVNQTNQDLSGAHTISSTPLPRTFTFAHTTVNIPAGTATPGGSVIDTTNQAFVGVHTVTGVNGAGHTVSYAKTHADIASAAVSGVVTNQTNVVFNGEDLLLIGVTSDTLQYNKAGTDVGPLTAAGTVTDTTNEDLYNGTITVDETPEYNTFTYTLEADGSPETRAEATIDAPYGVAYRVTSQAVMRVRYRSGWAG